MKFLGKWLAWGLGFFLLCGLGPSRSQAQPADLILYNGTVWTGDAAKPRAEAIAVRGEQILQVGKNEEILALRGERTQLIDLEGAFVLPGFNDSHIHFASAARFFWNINLMDVHTDEAFVQRVKEYVKVRPGEPIQGGGWGAYEQWEMGAAHATHKAKPWMPDRRLIDGITGDTPMFINKFDYSQFFANTAALRRAGFGERAEDTQDIEFIRDASGRLTGVMRFKNPAAARQWSKKFLGPEAEADHDKRKQMTENALRLIREAGVTSVQDMSDHEQLRIYYELFDEGKLTCRMNFRYGLEFWEQMRALGVKKRHGSKWIRLGTVKGHIDGIMGTRTARFYEPYSDDPSGKNRGRWRKLTWVSPDRPTELNLGPFTEMMLAADAADIQISVHAIGDEANGLMLDLVEKMIEANGRRDRRFRIVHAQVLAPKDFSRLRGLDVIAEVQPFHLSDDMRWMEERIGRERCKGAYAFKTLKDNGAVLCFGSDWPGTTASYYPINPIYGLYAAVTRMTVRGKPAGGWFPEQKISIEEAIKAYTWAPAYATFEEDIKGTISAGKLADITVLDTNLLNTDPRTWLDEKGRVKVQVLYTIVGGKVVYRASAADGR